MKYLKITIVTPVFNNVMYLEETIDSVLSQKYPNIEYIIQDGGSTDGSVEIIKKYQKYISYWESIADNGMYDAVEKGFARGSGEVMGWINSDDRLLPGSLYVINKLFSDLPSVNWISGLKCTLEKSGMLIRAVIPDKYTRINFLYGRSTIQQESTFWRRRLWIQAGGCFNKAFKYASDVELWARFFEHEKLYRVAILLGAFRRHGNQISQYYRAEYGNDVYNIRKIYRKRCKLYWLKFFINYAGFLLKSKANRYIPEITFDAKDKNKFVL